MYLEKINKLLLSFVDQGILSEFWYYIQEFANYEIFISIKNFESENGNDTEEEIIIGKLNNKGYYDIDNKLQDETLEFTAGHNFIRDYLFGKIEKKEAYEKFYGYSKELHTNFIDVGFLLSRKIDELFWLLLKANKLYEAFIGTLQYHLEDEEQDCYLQFSSSTYLKDLNENYCANIFGFDCEVVDNYLDFSPTFLVANSKKSEELLNDFKAIIQSEQKRIVVDLLSADLNQELTSYEDKFNDNQINDWLVNRYHSLIEKYIYYTYKNLDLFISQDVQKNIAKNFASLNEKMDDLKKEFVKKQHYTTKFRFNYLNLLFEICSKISMNDQIELLELKLSEIKTLSNLGFYRNQSSHGFDISKEKQEYAIKGYRFILELLVEYFHFVKKLLSEKK